MPEKIYEEMVVPAQRQLESERQQRQLEAEILEERQDKERQDRERLRQEIHGKDENQDEWAACSQDAFKDKSIV